MYVCHICGKNNAMKNGGWLDKFDNGGSFLGTTNVGRDYSPAWGGQFDMGGSLPGSVGFTYARTGDIPSNGKYAKKTLASAQNGKEMQFYQQGLDFQPKTISRKGSVIKDDRGQWAHPGQITEIDSNDITMQGVPYPVLGIGADGEQMMMQPGEDYKFNKGPVTEFPMAQKGVNMPAPTAGDSLRVHNAATKLLDYYKNDKRHLPPRIDKYAGKIEQAKIDKVGQENLKMYREMAKNLANPNYDYDDSFYKLDYGIPRLELLRKVSQAIGESKSASPGTAYYKDAFPSKIDINAPSAYIDSRISPQGFVYFDTNVNPRANHNIAPEPAGLVTGAWYYDPLAVKPYNMRTPKEKLEWEKKYGKKEQPKPQPKKESVKKPEPVVEKPIQKPVEKVVEKPAPPKPMNRYEGRPVYSPGAGLGTPSALIGFENKGDTTYIQPEDYERFAVPGYGKRYIESKKKLKSGGNINNLDAQPIEKLDQLTNFTNYNKPTKGGWLDKWAD